MMGLEAFSDHRAALGEARAEAYRRALKQGKTPEQAYDEAAKVPLPERDPLLALADLTRRFAGV